MKSSQFCTYCMSPVAPGESCPVCGLTEGSYTPSPHHLPPGTVLMDRYLVGRVLGEGGFGITYIGCDLRLELKVAIKEYFPTDRVSRHAATSLAVSQYTGAAARSYEKGKERFLYEARTMARMDKQPQIVSVRDFFEANNTAYIVMEYVEGTNFKDLVAQKGGRIPAGELLYLMEPLFSALSTMHSLGLIHRDISPDNLMLEKGAVRLLDFGCARESATGTETMTIALKHGYAPIEQYQNKGQGPWTDVYALSATIYYCLTGKAPPQALDRLCEDELILPRKLGVDLSEKQERALLYGMGVRPRRRFQSVEELHTALYLEDISGIPKRLEPDRLKDIQRVVESAVVPEKTETRQQPPEDQPRTEEPHQEKTAREEVEHKPALDWLNRHKPLAIGCTAAALGVVVLAAVLLGGGSRTEQPGDHSPAGTVTASAAPQNGEDRWERDTLFAGAVTAQGDEAELRALLADPSVPAVIIPEDTGVPLQQENLVISKPLLVEAGANLTVNCALTLEGESACLWTEGDVYAEGFLRTTAGGGVVVADTGAFSSITKVWLEHEDDLTVQGSGRTELQQENLVLYEEELFAQAATVSSVQELTQALENPEVSAVLVEGDVVLDQAVQVGKPVMIAQGASVSTNQEGAWTEDNQPGLEVTSGPLVNYGTLSTRLWMGENTVINYGTISPAGQLWLEPNATLVNLGEMELTDYTRFNQSRGYNLGTMRLNGTVDLTGGTFYNLKDFVVESGECALYENTRFGNTGTMTLSASFQLYAYLVSCGQVVVDDGGELVNQGLVELFSYGTLTRADGGELRGSGGYQLETNCALNNAKLPQGVVLQSWEANQVFEAEVTTAQELADALADPSVQGIQVVGALSVSGELNVTKPLLLTEEDSLAVDGTLTIQGVQMYSHGSLSAGAVEITDGGVLFNHQQLTVQDALSVTGTSALASWGPISMNGGKVTVTDRSMVNLYYVELENCGDLLLESGSRLAHLGRQTLTQTTLRLRDSAYFNLGGLELDGVTTQLESAGQLDGWNHLVVRGGTLEIDSDSYLHSAANLEFRDGAVVTNRGVMNLWGSGGPATLGGVMTNYGTMAMVGKSLRVTGQLDNQGRMLFGGDGELALAGGSVTGNPEEGWDDDIAQILFPNWQ